MNEVPIENVSVNENPPTNNKEIEEEVEFKDVDELTKKKECRMKRPGSLPSIWR